MNKEGNDMGDVTEGLPMLRALREKHGDESRVGRLCKNLIKMLPNLSCHVTPAWATHESQTMQGKIRWQIAQIEAALKR